MTGSGSGSDRVVIGYFSDGADAYRAINELIDEGFSAAELGGAFRTPRAGAAGQASEATVGEMKSVRELTEKNPAVTGSVGGAGSQDQAVTPAGLAPGSGNAFPGAPTTPGPIPGAEVPSSLPHDLPQTLPHDLPSTLAGTAGAGSASAGNDAWLDPLHARYRKGNAGTAERKPSSSEKSSQKFGTGEGRLDLVSAHDYTASAFESSFQGMGAGSDHARRLSGELGRGGAVVTVRAGDRVSLAESILERNGGRVRFEAAASSTRELDRESPVEVYGSMCDWYPGRTQQRRAS